MYGDLQPIVACAGSDGALAIYFSEDAAPLKVCYAVLSTSVFYSDAVQYCTSVNCSLQR